MAEPTIIVERSYAEDLGIRRRRSHQAIRICVITPRRDQQATAMDAPEQEPDVAYAGELSTSAGRVEFQDVSFRTRPTRR